MDPQIVYKSYTVAWRSEKEEQDSMGAVQLLAEVTESCQLSVELLHVRWRVHSVGQDVLGRHMCPICLSIGCFVMLYASTCMPSKMPYA